MESSFKDETGSPSLVGSQRVAVAVAGTVHRMRVVSDTVRRSCMLGTLEAVCAEHGVHGASTRGLRVGSPCKRSES